METRASVCLHADEKEIAKAPILAYYTPKKQTVFQTDARIKRFRDMVVTRWKTSLLCK